MTAKHVLLYEPADGVLERAPEHMPAHSALIRDLHARGDILMVGTFGDPQREGSMAIFPTREAAQAFVAQDPFVVHGLIARWVLRRWDEVLT